MVHTDQQAPDPKASKENIYAEYIIKLINEAQAGDKVYLVSPSTFFGFYSLGVRNFEEVCNAIVAAKGRDVEFKLIVNVYEPFSAAAGLALLKILPDRTQIRNLTSNTSVYFIILKCQNGDMKHYKFISEPGRHIGYLDKVQAIPFTRVDPNANFGQIMAPDVKRHLSEQFNELWDRSTSVCDAALKYDVDTIRLRKLQFLRASLCAVSFVLGILVAALASLTLNPELPYPILLTAGSSLLVNFLTTYFEVRVLSRRSST